MLDENYVGSVSAVQLSEAMRGPYFKAKSSMGTCFLCVAIGVLIGF